VLAPAPSNQPDTAGRRARNPDAIDWTRKDYGRPNANWQAVDLFGRLCQRYLPGSCVLFTGPVNPLGRERVAEGGLYAEYRAFLRVVAGRYGLIWRDYTDTLGADDFITPRYGGRRDPIHINAAGRAKVSTRLVDAVAEAVQAAL